VNLPGLAFRHAVAADAPAMGRFMTRNFLAAYGHCSTPGNIARAIDDYYGEEIQSRQIADPRYLDLLALAGEELAGIAQLRLDAPTPPAVRGLPAIELSRFYVDTTFHGTGVAAALMAQARRAAAERGARSLWLGVWQRAPQAIRFYEKQGFSIVGETVFMVGDDPMDDWIMAGPA
jgi:GNAT superfamily N-acetyltransferase